MRAVRPAVALASAAVSSVADLLNLPHHAVHSPVVHG